MDLMFTVSLLKIFQIIGVDILLALDNILIIALACRGLSEKKRLIGLFCGTVLAIILRIVMILYSVILLKFIFVKLIFGFLLYLIALKLAYQKFDLSKKNQTLQSNNVTVIVAKIVFADFVMSFDNVLAITAVMQNSQTQCYTTVVLLGLLLSIPIMFIGGKLMTNLFDRFPVLIVIGASFLGWIAMELILGDQGWDFLKWKPDVLSHRLIQMIAAIFIILVSKFGYRTRDVLC